MAAAVIETRAHHVGPSEADRRAHCARYGHHPSGTCCDDAARELVDFIHSADEGLRCTNGAWPPSKREGRSEDEPL